MQKIIYTIGHSTGTPEEFTALLQTFSIEMLVDVRSYPGHAGIRILIKKTFQKNCLRLKYCISTSLA